MKITCVADLHGFYPKLDGGDLLIIAGDLTAKDTQSEYLIFREWLRSQDYRKKIFIAGNHDGCIKKGLFYFNDDWMGAEYLFDSGTEFEGLKIWGSPWTPLFREINPRCKAFMKMDSHLSDKLEMIPMKTDILITHGPAYGILDAVKDLSAGFENNYIRHCGSQSLYYWLKYVERPKLHIFGHIHEGYGIEEHFVSYNDQMMKSINCSHVDENYKPVNKPINIEI
jgi:Icc-related predicted phosphoesterase